MAAALQRAFPSANVSHYSGALPATTSAFATPSIPKLVRPEADLVFVEYTVNDGWDGDETPLPRSELAKSFERTLRTLLSLPKKPAVVIMNALPSNASRAALPFWQSGEDYYSVLSQYYSLPSLSMRDAIWREYIEASEILRRAQSEADKTEQAKTGNGTAVAAMVDPSRVLPARLRGFGTWEVNQLDERHPTQRGQRMMSDLVVGLLQSAWVDMAVRGAVRARGGSGGGHGGVGGGQEGEGGGHGSGGDLLAVHDHTPLPPPMYEGNDAGAVALQCLLGKDLASAAVEGLAVADGDSGGGGSSSSQWRLVNDGDAVKQKWGLVADKPGAELVLVLDTRVTGRSDNAPAAAATALLKRDNNRLRHRNRRSLASLWPWAKKAAAAAAARDAPRPASAPPSASAPLDAELWVGITRSWRGQGKAELVCEGGGCRCEAPVELRGFEANGRRVTQNYVERVAVSQARDCRVVVRLPKKGGAGPDGGTRVKLVGVTVASSLPEAARAGGGC